MRRSKVSSYLAAADTGDAATSTLTEVIEAAVRSGQAQLAGGALQLLIEVTQPRGTDWGLGIEAGCRALLAEGDEADGLYREAIGRLRRTSASVQLARTHLLYGEWLRRDRRRLDAREQLRIAFEIFNAKGIEALAARARRELLATGGHARKRTVETRDELTPQENQVAQLARDGLSNAEIGARLFISRHTVGYHLRKVFSKLDIASRYQLDRALPENATAGQVT